MILQTLRPEGAPNPLRNAVAAALVLLAPWFLTPRPAAAQLPQAAPQIVPLTMQEAVALARQQNPTLLASRQNLYSVRALETQAAVRQNPDIGVAASDVTLGANNPSNPYTYAFQVSRLFERGQKRRWRVDSAKATTAQTKAQYRDQERSIVLNCAAGVYSSRAGQGSV